MTGCRLPQEDCAKTVTNRLQMIGSTFKAWEIRRETANGERRK